MGHLTNFDVKLIPYYESLVKAFNAQSKNPLEITKVDSETYKVSGDVTYKDFRNFVKANSSRVKESLGLPKRLSFKSKKWNFIPRKMDERPTINNGHMCSCGGGENNGHNWNCPWQEDLD